MSCLVVLELENGKPNRPSLATISAAKKLSNDIDVLILESENKEAVASLTDANNIFYFSSNQQNVLAEEIAIYYFLFPANITFIGTFRNIFKKLHA